MTRRERDNQILHGDMIQSSREYALTHCRTFAGPGHLNINALQLHMLEDTADVQEVLPETRYNVRLPIGLDIMRDMTKQEILDTGYPLERFKRDLKDGFVYPIAEWVWEWTLIDEYGKIKKMKTAPEDMKRAYYDGLDYKGCDIYRDVVEVKHD